MRLSSKILITEAQLAQRVQGMADAIAADTPDGSRLSVLALMDGAFMFCADLVRRLPMPVHLAMAPIRSMARGGDPTQINLPDYFPVEGADILIVEDILDTGQTLEALTTHMETLNPARVRLAVLLDKPSHREVQVQPDYIGFQVPDRWVVGYGLDWEGVYRNLPYISYIES